MSTQGLKIISAVLFALSGISFLGVVLFIFLAIFGRRSRKKDPDGVPEKPEEIQLILEESIEYMEGRNIIE